MNKPASKLSIAVILAAFLTACATNPVELAEPTLDVSAKHFTVAKGKANIYVVRTGGYTSSLRNLPVVLDGLHRGFLTDEMYFQFEVDPGTHTVVTYTSEDQGIITINAKEGVNYFIGYKTVIGWRDHRVNATELSVDEGMTAVKSARLAKRLK